jgi:hypothetical protein
MLDPQKKLECEALLKRIREIHAEANRREARRVRVRGSLINFGV